MISKIYSCKYRLSIQFLIFLLFSTISNKVTAQEHFDFNYNDRISLLADGWDFIATTRVGNPRNTEQLSGAMVSFDQKAHPGVLRIPVDTGDLWADFNNTRNSLFRNLPSNWTSIRLKISNFAPTQSYQQAGLVVYQDDNNYVQICRIFDGSNHVSLVKEVGGSASVLKSVIESANSNLYFRLDRNPATQTITSYYSVNGSVWTTIGNLVQYLNNPRLGIIVGASPGGLPNADFAWAEVFQETSNQGIDELRAHPSEIVFNAVQDQPLNDSRSIYIFTSLGETINWNQSIDVSWVQLSLENGVTDGVLKVSVNTTGLASGIHYGNVTIKSAQSRIDPIIIPVTLIINPVVSVKATTWKDGIDAAMSVSVDDGESSGFIQLQANGFQGTFLSNGTSPPSFYTNFFNAGMELGSHLVYHTCDLVYDDNYFRSQQIQPNILGICTNTPEPCNDVITLAWPCGVTKYNMQAVASEYYLSARGYNINQLEDATPDNFMNLKCYNSHEHSPYPPSDLRTLVDNAILMNKWFNLVLHSSANDDGAINYARSKNIWVAPIGTVIKYILQRDRLIVSNYSINSSRILFNASRLAMPSSIFRNFETAFGINDLTTLQIDIDDVKTVDKVFIDGVENHYQTKILNGNKVLLTNVKLESASSKTISINYLNQSEYLISLSTNTLQFNAVQGTNPISQSLVISTSIPDSIDWKATIDNSQPNWLTLNPSTGIGNGNISVSVNCSDLPVGIYIKPVTITSNKAFNSTLSVDVIVNVIPTGSSHYDFIYPDRNSLFADGWDYIAHTSSGASRNTEQSSGAMVSFDQQAHAGVIRIPVDVGDLWAVANNTRNSIFRNLPSNWTSVRLKISSFAPTRDYQQAGLVVYQDDNNYVQITRIFEGSNRVTFLKEVGGSASILNSVTESANSNLYFRLDRDPTTQTITSYYSLDGTLWKTVGNVTQSLNNPRLGIIVGASPGGLPNADIAWVEIKVPQTTPILSVSPANISFTAIKNGSLPLSQNINITNGGTAAVLDWTSTINVPWMTATSPNNTTPGLLNVSVNQNGLEVGSYNGTITLNSAGASNSPQVIDVLFTVNPEGSSHYEFIYPNRSSLLADGWDFIAHTSSGASRNTEQTSGAMVSFDQQIHAGVLRIPVDVGDLWAVANNTRNSIFRNLPSNWTSVRLKISAFAPIRDYQQAGLVVYQDDNNYVQITRIFEGSNRITLVKEVGGSASILNSVIESTSTNLYFRLDRDPATQTITSYYSLNGSAWTFVGNVIQSLNNPRLGIIVGASPGGLPNADFAWVEVIVQPITPMLSVSPTNISFTAIKNGSPPPSQNISITNSATTEVLDWTSTINVPWMTVTSQGNTTPALLNVSINQNGLESGTYNGTIILSSAGASNSPQVINVIFTVNPEGLSHYDFIYPNRSSLLADGWDFIARTTAGVSRNTERTSGAIVSFDQQAHAGLIRIPVDVGDLWADFNNTRNSIFRNLPTNWISIRLKISSFAPTQDYQQAGLVVYQDDNNYVQITRIFEGNNRVTFVKEVGGSGSIINSIQESSNTNLHFRLDRNPATQTITSYYSLDGSAWTLVGNVIQSLNNPRLGIIVGASPGGFPKADIAWVEIYSDTTSFSLLSLKSKNTSTPILLNGEVKQGSAVLDWEPTIDIPFNKYIIYRNSSPNFNIKEQNPYAATNETTYVDPFIPKNSVMYYKVYGEYSDKKINYISNEISLQQINQPDNVNKLYQNYPNPFDSYTWIEYDLSEDGRVILELFNYSGQKIETILDSDMKSGNNKLLWKSNNKPSGIYYLSIKTKKFTDRIKISKL